MNRSVVFDLATSAFIARHEDAMFLGPPGTGKSHLAQAIGQAAIQQGYRVLYRETHALLDDLAEATLDGTRKEHMEFLVTVPPARMGLSVPNAVVMSFSSTLCNNTVVLAQDVDRHFTRGYGDITVRFENLPSVITSKAANGYHFKTGQRDWPFGTENVLPCRLLWWQVGFGAPAPRAALEHVSVVQ